MYPGQFYKKDFTGINLEKGKKRYKGKNINSLPMKFWDGAIELEFMNMKQPISETTIMAQQLQDIKKNFPINTSLTNKINQVAFEDVSILEGSDITIEDMLEIFESVFTTSYGGEGKNTHILKALSNQLTKQQYMNNLNNYQEALKRLGELKSLLEKDQSFINEKEISPVFNKLDSAKNRLENSINKAENQKYSYGKASYFGDVWNRTTKTGGTRKYSSELIGYGNTLKGRWFEKRVIDFLLKYVINPDEMEVVDLANVYTIGGTYNIFGENSGTGSKKFRTDIALVNKELLDLPVKYFKNGNQINGTLRTFIDDCNKANGQGDNVSIDTEEWKDIFNKGGITGMQAKSGKNQAVINEYSVTAPDAFKLAKETLLLNKMLEWYKYNNIYATDTNVSLLDPIFNYGISHATLYIIGFGNSYLALRNKIVPTATYFEEQIYKYKKYIRAAKPVDLNNINENIPVHVSANPASFGKK